MSDHDTTAHHADAADAAHDAGHHDEHGHAADTLGSFDWRMWAVGALGVAAALAVVAGFVIATSFNFADLIKPG